MWVFFHQTIGNNASQDTFSIVDISRKAHEASHISLYWWHWTIQFRDRTEVSGVPSHLPSSPITFLWTLSPFQPRCSLARPLRDFFLVKFLVQVVVDIWRTASRGTRLQADDPHLIIINLSILTFALFAWLLLSLISGWEFKCRNGILCYRRLTLRAAPQWSSYMKHLTPLIPDL